MSEMKPMSLTFIGDPTVIVYAARWALGQRGSHAAVLVADVISVNAERLPSAARRLLVRDVSGWLDGPGATAARADRAPWVTALAAFGVRRSTVRTETPPEDVLPPPSTAAQRRRADERRAAS